MYVKVRVTPGVKTESFSQRSKDHFVVAVKEKAERNMANKRIIELIARSFGLPAGRVKILNGHRSDSKILSVDIDP